MSTDKTVLPTDQLIQNIAVYARKPVPDRAPYDRFVGQILQPHPLPEKWKLRATAAWLRCRAARWCMSRVQECMGSIRRPQLHDVHIRGR